MNTRTAIYARVSTRERGQHTQNQLHQLRGFAARQGRLIVSEFVDYESGSTDDREQFQAMFQAASRRQFDVLLFWSLDRFSREGVFETLTHLNRLTGYGVHYRSFTEQWFDSCAWSHRVFGSDRSTIQSPANSGNGHFRGIAVNRSGWKSNRARVFSPVIRTT